MYKVSVQQEQQTKVLLVGMVIVLCWLIERAQEEEALEPLVQTQHKALVEMVEMDFPMFYELALLKLVAAEEEEGRERAKLQERAERAAAAMEKQEMLLRILAL